MQAQTPSAVPVFLAPWAVSEDGLDVRVGEWLSLAARVLPRGSGLAIDSTAVSYLFDLYDLTAGGIDSSYVRIEGVVQSLALVSHGGGHGSEALKALSTSSIEEATRDRFHGSIVTFAAEATRTPIMLTPDVLRLDHRLGTLGSWADPATIIISAWQLDEEGFDVRPGDRLSWRVTPRKPDRWASLPQTREIHFVADTYLHLEGPSPAIDRRDGTVEPAHAAPEFVRIEGSVQRVEALRYVGSEELLRDVPSTRDTGSRGVDSYVIHLEAGAVLTASEEHDDERYDTSR
ncbi:MULTISPECIES: hypothetical protein [unclassified Agrococcus]|uniref:hypothetical protein n=1 Tax=unclassified Agrococcus TaxID=2615065 RepID=UPI00360DF52A